MSCWNSDLGLLQEKPVPITTEPSLASGASALIFTRTVADWLLAMCLDRVLGFCLVYLMESRTVDPGSHFLPSLDSGSWLWKPAPDILSAFESPKLAIPPSFPTWQFRWKPRLSLSVFNKHLVCISVSPELSFK